MQEEGRRRLSILDAIARVEAIGATRTMAVTSVAAQQQVSPSTLRNWFKQVEGIHPNDWLPYLAPERRGGGAEAEVDPTAWQMLISDYLRPEQPTWESCCGRTRDWCTANGVALPVNKTLFRKFEREIDKRIVTLRRKGREAAVNTMPPQRRSVAGMRALQLVNIDGNRADVFVRFPGHDKPMRPTIVAIQDVYSRKVLGWRVGESESAVLTRLAFHDVFQKFGIPVGALMDNGRAFASKWISGGAKTRFRFKIREEEPTGILTALGVQIHWATPHHGQAKPIERFFRDLTQAFRCPEFSGAYVGTNPMAKPENYGAAAIPLATFETVLARLIAVHNAKLGRRTEVAAGRSFDQVFNDSYAHAQPGRATEEQLRMALLTAEDVATCRKSGMVTLFDNRFWTPELAQIAGQRVIVRFDPSNLHTDIHVYSRDGQYLCSAPLTEDAGFLDVAAAKTHAKQVAGYRKLLRETERQADLLSAGAIAAMQRADVSDPEVPEPSIVRAVRYRGQTAAALKPRSAAAQQPETHSVIDRIGQLRLVK